MIALDIENDPVVCNKAGVAIHIFYVCRAVPGCLLHIMKPYLQCDGCIWMLYPEFTQDTPADDSHDKSISHGYQNGNKAFTD
jgi:hypothetical protein